MDEDGLDDSYLLHESEFPRDTDADQTPDFLDLDSDGDAFFDLIEIGLIDDNEDGQIDIFIDNNNDGFSDDGIQLLLAKELPDEDQDSIPDLIDSEFNGNGLFGCTLTNEPANDPVFPVTLLLMSTLYAIRRRKQQA